MNSGQHLEGPRAAVLPSNFRSYSTKLLLMFTVPFNQKVSEYLLLCMQCFHSSLGLRVEVVCIAVHFYLL